jgi:hypothetical protein
VRLTLSLEDRAQSGSNSTAKGEKMINRLDKLAWFGVALAVLAWAMVPRLASAHAVLFPQVPSVTVFVLPPPVFTEPAEVEDLAETVRPAQ